MRTSLPLQMSATSPSVSAMITSHLPSFSSDNIAPVPSCKTQFSDREYDGEQARVRYRTQTAATIEQRIEQRIKRRVQHLDFDPFDVHAVLLEQPLLARQVHWQQEMLGNACHANRLRRACSGNQLNGFRDVSSLWTHRQLLVSVASSTDSSCALFAFRCRLFRVAQRTVCLAFQPEKVEKRR